MAGLWLLPVPVSPWDLRYGERGDSSSRGKRSSGEDKDCSDFDTQAEAQRFFEAHQPVDPHNLDGNGDGEACESLP
ncbi:MAG: excalibur calcium-binding domain-containing protein [Desulfohalobiaceae bacterium]|nr:excalibur calcium-binding domain-containing protein [Desulfohalobiaceae bacterium]